MVYQNSYYRTLKSSNDGRGFKYKLESNEDFNIDWAARDSEVHRVVHSRTSPRLVTPHPTATRRVSDSNTSQTRIFNLNLL